MLQAIKEFLKKILPPPMRSFMREINGLRELIQTQSRGLSEEQRKLARQQKKLTVAAAEEQQRQLAMLERLLEQSARQSEKQEAILEELAAQKETLGKLAETVRMQERCLASLVETTGRGQEAVADAVRQTGGEIAVLTAAMAQSEEKLAAALDGQQQTLQENHAVLTAAVAQSEEKLTAALGGQQQTLQENHAVLTAAVAQSEEKLTAALGNQQQTLQENHAVLTAAVAQSEEKLAAALGGQQQTLQENHAVLTAAVAQSEEKLAAAQEALLERVQSQGEALERVPQEIRSVRRRLDQDRKQSRYENSARCLPEQYERELALWYRQNMGKRLELEDPKTYNEKIQWLKLYDSTPLKTMLSDKYQVRQWIRERIGEEYLIPLLGVWNSFDEIDFDALPDRFVLKATHGCGMNIIVTDKQKFDRAEAKKKMDGWLRVNYAFSGNISSYSGGLQLQYMNIPPRIIAEEYLENANDDLYDYKVFCFNGRAHNIMFLSERKQTLKMAFYDLDWNKQPFVYNQPRNEEDVPRPANLEKMVSLAETLARDFAHVRVDFYVLNDGTIKFGEMTFTSANGICRWDPPEQDRVFGDLLQLPPKQEIPVLEM